MRINKRAMLDLVQGWERQLAELHPRDASTEEKERVELATLLFQHEARTAMLQLTQEIRAAYQAEERLSREVDELRRKLSHANGLIKQLREKNRRLKG